MSLRWTDGTLCEKSPRKVKVNPDVEKVLPDMEKVLQVEPIKSLDEGYHWNKGSNKRETSYEKISEREMVSQIGQNPFLGSNSYLQGLGNDHLKSVATHFDKLDFSDETKFTYSPSEGN